MYPQITAAERYTLGLLRRLGYTAAAIARVLGRHRSTIGREVRRNATRYDGGYRPELADGYARSRRSHSRRNQRFSAADWAQVHARLREHWSPEQVAGRFRREHQLRISHETIYRHIWADKRAGGSWYTYLRGARKQCRKRYGHYDSRGRLAGKRPITARPAIVEARGRIGDWEADTILGAEGTRPCLLSLVERKTGYLVLGKLRARTTAEVNRRAGLLRPWSCLTASRGRGTLALHSTTKAHPAKAGAAKPRVLASSATPAFGPATDATQDSTTAELPHTVAGRLLRRALATRRDGEESESRSDWERKQLVNLVGGGIMTVPRVISTILLAGVMACPPLMAAQEWKDALRDSLKAAIKITKTDMDRLRLKEPGTILVVQREGITGSPSKDASMLLNKSTDGTIRQPGGLAAALSDKKTNRDFAVGERLYCIDIKVKDKAIQFWLLSTEMAPITVKGTTQQTRYKAALEFEFPEDVLPHTSADSVIAGMASVLTLEGAPSAPKTVTLGQTEAELEAAVGKPEKVLDLGSKKIYVYKDIKVTLIDGKVADVQ